MICPHCRTNNPDTARFCQNCGQELALKCSNCHAVLQPDARFCNQCGQPVQAQTPLDDQRLNRLTAVAPGTLVEKMLNASKSATSSYAGSLKERRIVTTLLTDVVGSTALSEQLDIEIWMDLLNRAFDRITQVIYDHEGTIARLLGDSLLAFFGAPVTHEDDPQRAVRAAQEILQHIQHYSQEVRDKYHVDFAMRVCMNTGPVIIGPVGDNLSYDFTAYGGTVNLTSRIKFAAAPMSIIITEKTYKFVSPYFECQDLGQIEVKGMTHPVRIYELQSARAVLGRTRGFSDLESPMVGREKELATLLRTCEAVQAGLGRGVLIMGEPGMGKTRLIQEWQQAAQAKYQSGPRPAASQWFTCRAVSYRQGTAFSVVMDLIRNMIGVTIGSTETESRTALQNYCNSLFGDDNMDVYPYLGHLMSVKLEGEAWQRTQFVDPQAMQTQYLQAMRTLLQAVIQQNPLILVLEDLHWADASSTELFTRLLPLVSSGPILFCLVSRIEREAVGWKLVNAAREIVGASLTEITLQNLTEQDSRSLVSNLLSFESLPEKLRKLIFKKAEGNPLYIEEVIRMLIDQHAIIHKDGAWIVDQKISVQDIPDNLQGLLLARIDRLPPEARYTLLVASVIGRSFPVNVLSEVLGGA